ncbi:MAG: T9SS type A sorting domain-containing protein [Crocinitomicaceae bacterium]|nr:T9SS type A sorting domain-containing protein [Crocinitomicaceae bacterium]MBP6032519.1 T9SS type A sorting domain-containing protein [Crocinitomicaceae bacterium]
MIVKLVLFFLVIHSTVSYSQQVILGNGGEANGLGGNASYSIGQVFDFTSFNSSFSIQEGVQQTYKINTDGLLEMESELFSIYPIPTSDFINIELKPTDFEFEYYVISREGSLVDKGIINSQNSTINLVDLKTGEYHVMCKSSKQFFTSKIIKL